MSNNDLSVKVVSGSSTSFTVNANSYQDFIFAITIPDGYTPVAISAISSDTDMPIVKFSIRDTNNGIKGTIVNNYASAKTAIISGTLLCVKSSIID